MAKTAKLLHVLCLIGLSADAGAEVHEAVQAALDWQLPTNECRKPSLDPPDQGRAAGGIVRHQPSNTNSATYGTTLVYDADPVAAARYQRQRKRWEACVSRYKAGLLEDFERLKASASHGLTRTQAETIAGKLAEIQAAVMAPDGIAEPAPATREDAR